MIPRLVVRPGPPLQGTVRPPGDKSITHRAYLLALLSEGESVVEAPNRGADCAATLSSCRALGLGIVERGDRVVLSGRGFALVEPERVLECGNSGTTLRLLAGVLAGQPFLSVLAGDESLHRRPVARVIEPLRLMGARLSGRDQDRLPPLVIQGGPLQGIVYALTIPSAQVASCLLLAGIQARGSTAVTLPGPARDHTERLLQHRGVPVEIESLPGGGRRVVVTGPSPLPGATLSVPGDFSAAAFFLAAAAATPGAAVTATHVGLNPTRTGLLDVLEAMGAEVRRSPPRVEAGEPVGDVTVVGPERLRGFDVPPEWVPRLIDEVPAWIVAAAVAAGRSRLSGAGELRLKESDRLSSLAANLGRLGVQVREDEDEIEIVGGPVQGGTVSSDGDHRIAMAFAVLATRARGPITVEDPGPIGTSFPGFADVLADLGGELAEDPRQPAHG